ncbi:MAG: hypothetical protein IJR88_01835 [Clostridia bacterium]|nr:hypothetical protein [Clostridia bacterium]
MKTTMRILTVLLAALLLFGLCACGSKNATELIGSNDAGKTNSGNSGKTSTAQSAADLAEADKAMLEGKGYIVYKYTSYLEGYDAALKVESGSVKAYLYAYNNDGDGVHIYYFKTEQLAMTAYNNSDDAVKPSYKLKGVRLLLNDTTGLFD